jgi:iron complex transport system ATP-binding protein
MIAARELDAGYPSRRVLQGVNLEVRTGELLAIVGPNGAGKSTLLRTLAGLLRPLAGSVLWEERDVHALTGAQRARALAFVPADDASVGELRVEEIVVAGRVAHRPWWRWGLTEADAAAVARAIATAGLERDLERPIASLSSGEAQRAWIGMALAQDTPVLLLDEPTSHLDVRRAHETLVLLATLAREGRALGVVLHDLNLAARYADRVAVVAGGTLAAVGRRDDVIRPEILSAAYEADVRVLQDDDGTPVAVARAGRRSTNAAAGGR